MNRARLLVSKVSHSSVRLCTLPITSCSLHLYDKAIYVAVSLRLVLSVTSRGMHGLSCRRSTNRSMHHHQINDAYMASSEMCSHSRYKRVNWPAHRRRKVSICMAWPWYLGKEAEPSQGTLQSWTLWPNSYTLTTSVAPSEAAEAATLRRKQIMSLLAKHISVCLWDSRPNQVRRQMLPEQLRRTPVIS